jgi:hypothetical protein
MPIILESKDRVAVEATAARLRDAGIAAEVLAGEVAGDVITDTRLVVAEEDREVAMELLGESIELPDDPEFVDEEGNPVQVTPVEFGGLAIRFVVVTFVVLVIAVALLLAKR